MQGLDVALLRLAGTVLGAVVRTAVAPRKGAGLVPAPVRPLPRPASPDRLAKVLGSRLTSERYASLAQNERLAAVDGVRDTFAAALAAGPIDAARLFAVDLAPERLRDELRAPDAALADRTLDLYDDLLGLCCAHVVEQLTAEPSFAARAAVEHARVAGRTRDAVETLAAGRPRPEAEALAFEERYARFVAATHGRVELFGLTLGRSAREWPLDTAYISLAVSGDREAAAHGLPHAGPATVTAETALTTSDRLLLRGPAGSGKSTLVQWLALNAARRSFTGELADWNRCVPFVLRLRAFTSADALPTPEEFLRATGVPLTPPPGWTEQLLSGGRALVLVDGVDEVPVRLRQRTETWLKHLIAAFPAGRYVVTTRPSAVPEEWLARQGFTAHSLLPMDRDGIRAFIAHWHEAARAEDPADEVLDTYEKTLRQAVNTRRDLGRLATNPLMCALLCALNRDRRMQLPRARKELYDAALDMLLVRRDTERDICGVEGVDLTREEQTALLQRLAYWLIRNGQVQADRAEAEEMVAEWLTAMPQVRGTARQVFAHLLIRSGLLREPAPGTVDFVHRTFLDYLGAKAAVEARDFGVLVRNAHDDTWDDVVQMAVGHARVEERARLLRHLLRRADRAPKLRHRLVLLAAACLEQAPELDPVVRDDVRARTAELVPPRSPEQAAELAKVGELALELLPGPELQQEAPAVASIKTAELIGGDGALAYLARWRGDERRLVGDALSRAWGAFRTDEYADIVLRDTPLPYVYLRVRSDEQFEALGRLPHTRWLHLHGNHVLPGPLRTLTRLSWLYVSANSALTDLTTVTRLTSLSMLGLDSCGGITDLTPLLDLDLKRFFLYDKNPRATLAPLARMAGLTHVNLDCPLPFDTVGELPLGTGITHFGLYKRTRRFGLDGIERWPELECLTVSGDRQGAYLERLRSMTALRDLQVNGQAALSLGSVSGLAGLQELEIRRSRIDGTLEPLKDLPVLTRLMLAECSSPEPLDLSPLADLPGLTIELESNHTPVVGADLFRPEQLVIR
ncbi:NACHT domain-containing protein [Streptomyces vilmorinianum]|uniref:NACHT domain-containing protein n=1 Tax=Streptomyces vilmorinianum TaxID=3051092 RepID=UPI0020C80153|nr:NACHT domain-containing protein [Streptomyces vilmorinianum]